MRKRTREVRGREEKEKEGWRVGVEEEVKAKCEIGDRVRRGGELQERWEGRGEERERVVGGEV